MLEERVVEFFPLLSWLFAVLFIALLVLPYLFPKQYDIPTVLAQPLVHDYFQPSRSNGNNMTSSLSSSSTANLSTSYTIEGVADLLTSKLPMIKKAALSQVYAAIGIAQKGSNNTGAQINSMIINEIDNSTASANNIGTMRSATASQIDAAIGKLIGRNNNDGSAEVMKLIIDNKAVCSNLSASVSSANNPAIIPSSYIPKCDLQVRIHQ
jgi:hypothetical protein